MAQINLKSLAAGFSALGLVAYGPLTGNAIAQEQNAPVTTVAASDAENVNFVTDRNFVIRYNPGAEGFSPSALEGTISDINDAGCDVGLETRRYGSFYNLKAPWYDGGRSFRVDDVGTAGGIAIDLCRDGDLGSGPA
ncbi:MAG: hypothetical protein AAFQ24_12820 [Pseudomonadota bacterium]